MNHGGVVGVSVVDESIREYETIFVIAPSKSEEDVNNLLNKFKNLIESNGTLGSVEIWGKRVLAYPIDHFKEGYYVLINFSSNADFPKELSRVYRITDGIIRDIVVKKVIKKVQEKRRAKAVKASSVDVNASSAPASFGTK